MSDCMNFPDDWREFLRDFSFKDTEEIYTNGSELIPVFRVEQLIEHLELNQKIQHAEEKEPEAIESIDFGDKTEIMANLEGLTWDDWRLYHSDTEVQNIAKSAFYLLITLLKKQEARELTMAEWQEWKANPKRNPICELWEYDTSPMWVLNPNDVHEPLFLMGKIKLFTGKPTLEQCKAVKWNEMGTI